MAVGHAGHQQLEDESSILEKLLHWLFFGVIMTLIPFMAAIFGDIDRGINLSLAAVFGQGELLIVATVLSAEGIGQLVGSEASKSRRIPKLIVLGFCVTSLVATCIWFADISSLLITKHPADPNTVASGSVLLFSFAFIEGLAALVLSEAPHGRD
jgi:hypothetical protein